MILPSGCAIGQYRHIEARLELSKDIAMLLRGDVVSARATGCDIFNGGSGAASTSNTAETSTWHATSWRVITSTCGVVHLHHDRVDISFQSHIYGFRTQLSLPTDYRPTPTRLQLLPASTNDVS